MRRIPLILLAALLLAGLSASCKPRGAVAIDASTATPLPTSTAKNFPVIASPACKLVEYEAMRTRQAQGDLLAWDPKADRIAFAGPSPTSNWYSGLLYLAAGPTFLDAAPLAKSSLIFGDLTWSPDGAQIAVVGFRQPDVYTILVVNAASGVASDLFVNQDAKTDSYAGSKAIVEWRLSGELRVLTSCGIDCDQTLSIVPATGQITPVGEKLRQARDRLYPRPSQKAFEETVYPPAMRTPTPGGSLLSLPQMRAPDWTTDGKKAVYIDSDLFAWVILPGQKVQYELDTPNTNVQEAKWSQDGRYVAVRTDDNVVIFDTACKPPQK